MFPNSPYLVALIALVPGVVAWWTGRHIAAHKSDPALPELLWAQQQRTRNVFFTSFFVTLFLGGRHAFWGLLVMAAGATIGSNPLRQTLGIENASLARQLWRNAKSIAGGLGFWIALTIVPEIVLSIDPQYRMLSLLLIPLLLAWEHWYPTIWLRAHDAEPLRDEPLVSRFLAIDARAGIASPRVYRIGGPDARFTNALALPSVREPAIGLGNALVDLLEPDEVAAIYAHELSHIEQFSPRKIRRFQLITRILIVASVILPLIVFRFSPIVAVGVPWLWPGILFGTLALRARGSKTRETESDLRAAALCGDPEIMIRALIKVHVHGFIPRRWDVDFERQASHPSLTRRIQALRGDTAHVASVPDTIVVLQTGRGGSIVAFDNTRAYWFDGVPPDTPLELEALRAHAASARSVAWGELVELRVVVRGDNRALQAKHRNGDSWSVPLDSSHVEPMQKALDVVDVRLQRELGKRSGLDMRLVATIMIVAILWASEVSVLLIPAMIGVFKPGTVMLAALGSMATASGLFGLLREWSLGNDLASRFVVLALVGAAALWTSWFSARREGKRDGLRLAAFTCGGLAALLVVAIVLVSTEMPIRDVAHRGVVTGFAMSLVGLATALSFARPRASKVAAGSALALAAVAIAPSIGAMDLIGGADRFARARASATEIGRVALGGNVMELNVSPKGDRFLVRQMQYDGDDEEDEDPRGRRTPRYIVGSFTGGKRTIEAHQVALADESHVLVLRRVEGVYELRLEGEDSVAVWTKRLPAVRSPVLSVAPSDKRWTILSQDAESDSLVVLSGSTDGGEPVVRRMASQRRARRDRGPYGVGPTVPLGERVVGPSFEYKPSASAGMLAMFAMTPRVDLWETTTSGEQTIGHLDGMPQCGATEHEQALCVVTQQRERGQLWTIEQTGPARYVGVAPVGDMGRVSIGPGARVSGVRMRDAAIVTIDLPTRKVWSIKLPNDSGFVTEARSVPGRLVVLRHDSGKAILLAYRVDGL